MNADRQFSQRPRGIERLATLCLFAVPSSGPQISVLSITSVAGSEDDEPLSTFTLSFLLYVLSAPPCLCGEILVFFLTLFLLRFPIVIDRRIVVWQAPFVLGVVELIGHIDQQWVLIADDFVPVRHPRRNQHLPGPHGAQVQSIARAESGRPEPQVGQHHLKKPRDGRPAIGLMRSEERRVGK